MKKIINVMVIMIIVLLSISNVPTFAAGNSASSGSSNTGATGISGSNSGDSLDRVMTGANDFLNIGATTPVNEAKLRDTSNLLFNILLGIAMVAAVIIGMVIGIKFMAASVDEKAKIKEQLVPYAVGCFVIFGAFGIWKLAITVLASW